MIDFALILRQRLRSPPRTIPALSLGNQTRWRRRFRRRTVGGRPVLLRVDYQGGHGGIGVAKNSGEKPTADQCSFLLWQFRAPEFQPKLQGGVCAPPPPALLGGPERAGAISCSALLLFQFGPSSIQLIHFLLGLAHLRTCDLKPRGVAHDRRVFERRT